MGERNGLLARLAALSDLDRKVRQLPKYIIYHDEEILLQNLLFQSVVKLHKKEIYILSEGFL